MFTCTPSVKGIRDYKMVLLKNLETKPNLWPTFLGSVTVNTTFQSQVTVTQIKYEF